jgi:cob(I)alamin adenosyltransferase
MKIYTKTGDEGKTSLIGGTRVAKHHVRIEAYGTIDELNSFIGLIRDVVEEKDKCSVVLQEIQDRLFTIGSSLASDPEKSRMKIPDLNAQDITLLEKEMDRMNEVLPELKSFVLPGGNMINSYCHISRCVCRRAERLATHLSEQEWVEPKVLQYLNRLSDYLFVLARMVSFNRNAREIPWKPRV